MRNIYNCKIDRELSVYLRDIVDVLYNGQCRALRNDELAVTIIKKIERIKNVRNRENKDKMKKVGSITCSALMCLNACPRKNSVRAELMLQYILNICNCSVRNN